MSFSGGGFSNYFATPDYQADVVGTYVDSLGSEYAGLYNKTGRGYPDVAAQGVNFQVSVYRWVVGPISTPRRLSSAVGQVASPGQARHLL